MPAHHNTMITILISSYHICKRINKMKNLFLLFLTTLIISCGTESYTETDMGHQDAKGMPPAMEESQSSGGTTSTEEVVFGQQIIRNGTINIEVIDALKAKLLVDEILTRHKAHAGNEQFDNNEYNSSYHIQIRVPAESLNALVTDLEQLDGHVIYKAITSTDVTVEFIDLETRLTNKRSYLDQYRVLLKEAKTIEDILKVQEQIRILLEEIESVEGRLKYLQSQIKLSTLELTLVQKKDFVYRPDRQINFFERLKDAVAAGWYGFVQFGLVLIGLWPFWLVIIVLMLLIRRYRRKKKTVQ